MDPSVTLEVPPSGGKVELILPSSSGGGIRKHTFDVDPPGGTVTMNLTPNDTQSTSSSAPAPPRMLFSSLPMPFEKLPSLKYTPEAVPKVEPRISTYVPARRPTPDPNDKFEEPPTAPPELSTCKLLMYGYRINSKLCEERGFRSNLGAVCEIGECMDELRIGDYAKRARVPLDCDLEIYYFALQPKGHPVNTVSGRGVPAEKMKELEARMKLESACWIRFDEVLDEIHANRLERTT